MAFRRSSLLSLGAFLLLTTSAMAAEEFAKGMAVARELTASDGARFLMSVRPPADRPVDPRIFDAIEFVPASVVSRLTRAGSGPGIVRGAPAPVSSFSSQAANDSEAAIDVSGYVVRVETLAASAACGLRYNGKTKKVSLGPKKSFFWQQPDASEFIATVFPTSGNVDAYIYQTTQDSSCGNSTRGSGQLDFTACIYESCGAGVEGFDGEVYNPTGSTATWVGVFTSVIVQ